jgi:type III secretion protein S
MADAMQLFQQAMLLSLIMSAPPLAVATVLGLTLSLVMTVFQLQEQTLPFIVKLAAVSVTLILCGRWMGLELMQLMERAFDLIPAVAG